MAEVKKDVVKEAPKVEVKEPPKAVAKTVRMVRHLEGAEGPREADVHPDEVANWQKHGWVKE